MIGLDLGSKFAKACSVFSKNDGTFIVYAAMAPMPKEDRKEEVFKTVNLLLRQLKFKKKELYLSAGGVDLLARDFVLPKIGHDRLRGAVMMEAESNMSESLDNMYSDFYVLSSPADNKTEVLFVASSKERIDKMIDSLSLTDADIAGVTADGVAVTNAFLTFNNRNSNGSIIIINIGDVISNISILDRGELKFIRNVDFGGRNITEEISSLYEIDFNSAEKIKRHPEVWPQLGFNVKNILKKSAGNLLEAIFRSMEYCVSKQRLGKIDEIYITGGGALLQGIDVFIWDILGIKTAKWNPFESDKIKGEVNKEAGYFASVVLGLALAKELVNV
ncbi:MAG: pilus assembly protein PilM [Endomicrobium sp.]|jgi:type IV pilus assembly protein PilM|nr:pilus assembly protein PilM [Endomicrobium sp.]